MSIQGKVRGVSRILAGTRITVTPSHGQGDVTIGGGGHRILDEGVALTDRADLDFVGAGVTVTDDAPNTKTKVTIPGGGGGAASPDILRAAASADLALTTTAQDVTGATVTLDKAGLWLVVGVFDVDVTATGGGPALGRLNAGGVVQSSDAVLGDPVERASVTQVWKYNAAVNDVAKLQALKSVAGGTITVKATNTSITATFIGGLVPIWEQLWEAFDANTDPVDTLIQSGAYRLFIFFGSHNAASSKAATNAVFTVPVGKKLIVLSYEPSTGVRTDTANRFCKFRNVTDGTDVLAETDFNVGSASFLVWSGDLGNPSKLKEVVAEKQVRLEIRNVDANKRAMGGWVLCREVTA